METRLIVTAIHETCAEAGAPLELPTTIVTATAVIANPVAGRGLVQDLSELESIGAEVAAVLVERAVRALAVQGLAVSDVRGYGKGAIVGTNGDREHTAAVLHPRFGAPVRAALGGGADIIPGTKKVGGPGSSITMPIGNKDDRWEFDDMDAIDVCIPDAPRPDEMVVSLAISAGGRPHARTHKPTS